MVIDFVDQLLHFTLILRNYSFVTVIRTKKPHALETFLLNSWKSSKKLSNREIDF